MSWWLQHYGKTYEQWVEEKADRIHRYLEHVYFQERTIDPQELIEHVYLERIKGIASPDYPIRKYLWKPVTGRLTDFKPSPFIKNFVAHLIEQLKARGYLLSGYVVEIAESIRATDEPPAPQVEYLPRVTIEWVDKLIALPTKEELMEICRWEPDPDL